MVEVIAMWAAGDETGAADAAWADRVHASLADDALPGGTPTCSHDQVRAAWGPHADRLRAVKERVDPGDVFRAFPLPAGR